MKKFLAVLLCCLFFVGGPIATKADPGPIGGPFTAMVAPSANGTLLPSGPNGVRIYLPAGTSVTYTIASSAPGAPPTLVNTVTSSTGPWVDENLSGTNAVYVTAVTGSPFYRLM